MKVAFESAGLEVGPYEVVTDRQWTHEREESAKRITAPTSCSLNPRVQVLLWHYQSG